MTRILTITSWYPPHHFGGYELSCFDVMTRFSARGHDVRVLCGDERVPGATPPDPAHEQIVHRELRQHWREASRVRPPLRERIAIERHNAATLERHLAEFKPDVVSVWHMVAISLTLVRRLIDARIPILYAVCDDWPVYGKQVDAWVSLFSRGSVAAVAGRAVASVTGLPTSTGDIGESGAFCFVSESTRRRVTATEPWSYPVSTVVYSGIERDEFPRLAAAPGRPWRWRILYVGRLDAWKGVDTLLRAFAQLPEQSTLTCYGRGAAQERERLTTLAQDLGLSDRVTFGTLERHELAAAYADADILVFPSEWPEPFGLVPIEAMACGTPVVATAVGGSAEFLRDGYNCVLFDKGDVSGLADAVRRLHGDAALRRRVAQGGLRTADELDVTQLAEVMERWHLAAADRFAHGRPDDRVLDLPRPVPAAEAGDLDDLRIQASDVVFRLSDRLEGLVLSAGMPMPKPAATSGRRARTTVTVDFDPAECSGGGRDAGTMPVGADVSRLPFRTGVFDAITTLDTLARIPEDAVMARELARVLKRGGRAVFATPNRGDALVARAKFRDRIRGLRRPSRAYFHSTGQVRDYTWRELERLLRPMFRICSRHPIGWNRNWRGRAASAFLRVAPLRRFSQAIVLEAERR